MKINLNRQPDVYGVDWHEQKLKFGSEVLSKICGKYKNPNSCRKMPDFKIHVNSADRIEY